MKSNLVFILKRLVSLIPVLLGISFIVFFLIRLIPGDPATTLLGFARHPGRGPGTPHPGWGSPNRCGAST